MKLEIEIDEGYIAELVSKEIARLIIERVVERATVEIVKKGVPKLLEKAIATDVKEATP